MHIKNFFTTFSPIFVEIFRAFYKNINISRGPNLVIHNIAPGPTDANKAWLMGCAASISNAELKSLLFSKKVEADRFDFVKFEKFEPTQQRHHFLKYLCCKFFSGQFLI